MQVKTKEDRVKTERFPVLKDDQETELFERAVLRACQVYRLPVKLTKVKPEVDWEMLAKATGQRIRHTLAKPILNDGTFEKAKEMFEANASDAMVAKAFGVDRSTANRWRKKARTQK
tara:strand:- start:286 stop:636 length:351 start_codon:yes stop_codon:yes gene_type:complete